jgi:hypothetical protein
MLLPALALRCVWLDPVLDVRYSASGIQAEGTSWKGVGCSAGESRSSRAAGFGRAEAYDWTAAILG